MKDKTLYQDLVIRHRGSDTATAIRGIAALWVFLIHSGGLGLRDIWEQETYLGTLANAFVDFGVAGPAIFFVASGFALSAALTSRPLGFRALFFARVVRLGPLYWLVLSLALLLGQISSDGQWKIPVLDTLGRFLFLNGIMRNGIESDPIGGVSWTIPVELVWSLAIPFFLLVLKRPLLSTGIALFLIAVLLFAPLFLTYIYNDVLAYKHTLIMGIFFFLGAATHRVATSLDELDRSSKLSVSSFAGFLAAVIVIIFVSGDGSRPYLTAGVLTSLVLVAGTLLEGIGNLKVSAVLVWLGTVCYGIYLWHPLFLQIWGLSGASTLFIGWAALLSTLVFASASWLFLEKPIISFFKSRR